MIYRILFCVLTAICWSFAAEGAPQEKASSQIPLIVNYQGHISTGGAAFDGSGDFRFALVDDTTGLNLWTNDNSEVGTLNPPTTALSIAVSGGLYGVGLGDGALMAMIPSNLFQNTDLALRVWFDDGVNGLQQLSPDQPLTTAPFAVLAQKAQQALNADTVGGVSAGDLEESAEIDGDIATHAAVAAAHHAKTTSAAELSGGTLADARLSTNVTVLGQTIDLSGTEVTGTLPDAKIPAAIARDSEIDADIATHAASAAAHHAKTVDAAELSAGTLADARLSTNVTLLGQSIDADTVDGQHASEFMPVGTDNWVNTSGDAIAGSSSSDLLAVTNTGTGTAVKGDATNTGNVTNYGGYFYARGATGRAVYGYASDTTGTNYGGKFHAAGASGRAVYGDAENTGNVLNYGGEFYARGVSGRAVYGEASETTGTNYGGYFYAKGATGRAVYGYASDTTGTNYGGRFFAAGATGKGVHGKATNTTGTNYGGEFYAAGTTGRGVYGIAENTTGTNYGGQFYALGSTGRGVYGSGKAYDFYAGGTGTNYGPFTGGHEVILAADFPAVPRAGLIVCATGETQVRRDDKEEVSLSSTMPTVRLADAPNDKAVFGVLVAEVPLGKDHWYQAQDGERFGTANALGEGRVWVCNANGNTEVGDYITTSAVPGYGQRQDDDFLHSYTLGKVTETVDWDAVEETVSVDGVAYKVYLIAIVYTSG